jgi:FlaA1/EpsC-like NDP-sugar epimerase
VLASAPVDSRWCAVRFGNVLGSRGSVVPTFMRQIQQGGPVTLTHPEMTRFFMSIPEAVQLVLQAAALAEHREIFMLDMGEPVRIVDLANRMISLAGYRVGVDIEVAVTGLRPGEKLAEELYTPEEDPASTAHPKVLRLCPVTRTRPEVEVAVESLDVAVQRNDRDQIRAVLFEQVGSAPTVVSLRPNGFQVATEQEASPPDGDQEHARRRSVGVVSWRRRGRLRARTSARDLETARYRDQPETKDAQL